MPSPPITFRVSPTRGFPLIGQQHQLVNPSAYLLTDNFDDNSQDATKWSSAGFYAGETTGGTASETNQRLEATPTASAIRAIGYVSASVYDLTGDAIFVQISNVAAFSTNEVAYLSHGPNDSNCYSWLAAPGFIIARRSIAGAVTDLLNTSYSATTYAWFRIRHQSSDNTIHFETAPSSASNPPAPGDWTNQVSETFSGSLSVKSGKIAIGAALFSPDASPGAAYFDGFNTATTTTASSTGTGASTEDTDTTAASGTVAVSGAGASTENADTTSASGTAAIAGSGASTEATDTTSAAGTVSASASGSSTEGTDTTAATGTASVNGSGASTESADTGGAAGAVSIVAAGASTEGTDTTSATGPVSITGSGASTEGTDSSTGSGTVAQPGSTGTGTGAETDDTTSGAGLTLISGTGSAFEAADICVGSGSTLSISFGHIQLWMGTGFVTKPAKVWNGVAWVTKPLKYWTGTAWRATSY